MITNLSFFRGHLHIWDINKDKVYITDGIPDNDKMVDITTIPFNEYFPCNIGEEGGSGAGQNGGSDTPSESKFPMMFVVGGVALVALFGLAVFFFIIPKKKKSTKGKSNAGNILST